MYFKYQILPLIAYAESSSAVRNYLVSKQDLVSEILSLDWSEEARDAQGVLVYESEKLTQTKQAWLARYYFEKINIVA